MSYETQGYYPDRSSPTGFAWKTHIKGLTLEQGLRCYRGFKYGTYDWAGCRTSPKDARLVNSDTGEVIEVSGMHLPVKLAGHAIKTIPVTEDEWRAIYRRHRERQVMNGNMMSDKVTRRKDGSISHSVRGENGSVYAYTLPDGSHRVRPGSYVSP